MADPQHRENYIPLRKAELIELLAADPDWSDADRVSFRSLCRVVDHLLHREYQKRLDRVETAYVPFDPDSDTRVLASLTVNEKEQRLYAMFRDFGGVVEEAGYQHLSAEDIAPGLHQASAWGLRMDVDFRVFERLAIFVRGSTVEKRPLRSLRKAYRLEEREVPIYRRVVMLFKLRPHKRLGPRVDTEHVYLQLFKNIPHLDLNMLLPGARVRMSYFDRSRVGLPLLSGLALTLWQIVRDIVGSIVHFVNDFILFKPAAIWAVASGTLGYGVKSYYGYYQTKQRYLVSLLQVLYFQNLDTNAGVLHRLLHEAQEQDCREVVLAYFVLCRLVGEEGATAEELNQLVEQELKRRANLHVDFDHYGCLARIEKLGITENLGERYRARPLEQAVAKLETLWNEQGA